jgi:hypothetical protein
MPVLELTPEMMCPDRARQAVIYLEALMLYPDKAVRRARALETSGAALHLEELNDLAQRSNAPGLIAPSDLLPAVRSLADAMPVGLLHKETMPLCARGLAAAEILIEALNDHYAGEGIGLGRIKEKVQKRLVQHHPWRHLSMSTIDNQIWRTFRPVAHLFSANLLIATEYHNPGTHPAFPCQTHDVMRFLAIAEALRLAAEGYILKQYGKPLLDPRTTWSAPLDLGLPALQLNWPI